MMRTSATPQSGYDAADPSHAGALAHRGISPENPPKGFPVKPGISE